MLHVLASQGRAGASYRTTALVLRVLYLADVSAAEVIACNVGDLAGDGLTVISRMAGTKRGERRRVLLTEDGAAAAAELAGDRRAHEPLVPGRTARGRLSWDRLADCWAIGLIRAELPHVALSALRRPGGPLPS